MRNEIIKNYMRYLKLGRNFSKNTLDAYYHDLNFLLEYADKNNLVLTEMKLEDLENFSASLHDRGVSARSQARILSGIRSFYRYLVLDDYIKDDPTELLVSPQIGKHLPEYLSVEEVDMLEAAIDLEKWEGQRNKAIIETLFSCGLRVSELVNLKKSDVFEEEKFIRVIGKGNKERIVPISGKALKEINLWYIDRNLMTIKPGEEDYVFLNRRGAHLTRNMILIMIKNAAYDAGIKKTISPHTLRHSFATALLKGGADLRVIQALLGHEDIGTTEIYTHLETSDLRRAILEHHPRNIKYSEENQVLDYDKTDKATQMFYAETQNKLLYAVTGQTSAEIVTTRADADAPNMGLTSWKGAVVRKQDVIIAKNYLTHDELDSLNRLVVIFLETAEFRAKNRKDLTMNFWRENVDKILLSNDQRLLSNAGMVRKEHKDEFAYQVYEEFNARRKRKEAIEADREDMEQLKELENEIKNRPI